jgi:hypothetical protein
VKQSTLKHRISKQKAVKKSSRKQGSSKQITPEPVIAKMKISKWMLLALVPLAAYLLASWYVYSSIIAYLSGVRLAGFSPRPYINIGWWQMLLFAAALLLIFYVVRKAISLSVQMVAFKRSATKVVGVVLRNIAVMESGGYVYHPEIEYTTSDGERRVFVSEMKGRPALYDEGDRVHIYYSDQGEGGIRIDSFFSFWWNPIGLLLLASVISFFTGVFFLAFIYQ